MTRRDAFPPGDYIREELDARGLSQLDLAHIMDRPIQMVNELVNGKKAVTPETAYELGAAFGTSAEMWLTLETAYRLASTDPDTDAIRRRAGLFKAAPIREMQRRHWIRATTNAQELDRELTGFVGEEPLSAAARMTMTDGDRPTASQAMWFIRARMLGSALPTRPYDEAKFDAMITKLRPNFLYRNKVRHVPTILSNYGIRFVIIEHLSGSKIDGAALWLDKTSPVVAVSLRYGRVDWFWFTLLHELTHIRHRDEGILIDANLVGKGATPSAIKPEVERRADREAANALIPEAMMESFISRVGPIYSKDRIVQFAHTMRVHPGIVVGQLQYRSEIPYRANREMLVDVRQHITATTGLVDGLGHVIDPDSL